MSEKARSIVVRELMRKYSREDFSYSFEELKALISEVEVETPAEVRDTLTLCSDFDPGHYDEGASCAVVILREETKAETEARASEERAKNNEYEARRRREAELRDEAEYRRLKAKYG